MGYATYYLFQAQNPLFSITVFFLLLFISEISMYISNFYIL